MAIMTEINKMKVSSACYSSHKMNISRPITQLVKYTKLMLNFTWTLKTNVPYFEKNLLRKREKKKTYTGSHLWICNSVVDLNSVSVRLLLWLFNVHIHIWYCNSDSFYFGEWRLYIASVALLFHEEIPNDWLNQMHILAKRS